VREQNVICEGTLVFTGRTGFVYVALLSLFHHPREKAVLSSVISSWQISWAAPSMLARVDSGSGSTMVDLVRVLWLTCPARISSDRNCILISPALALAEEGA
jgi:hypothetical protein